jgi:hypothetical protein
MNTYMAAFQGRLVLFMECTATNTKLKTTVPVSSATKAYNDTQLIFYTPQPTMCDE